MTRELRVGERVALPAPFTGITGNVIEVYGTGPEALVTVEYPLDEGRSETLTKGYRARQLRRVPVRTRAAMSA